MQNPYDILGVSKKATREEIKKSYRALARIHHPDRAPNNAHAETRFKAISAAYALLSDPTKRAAYDNGEIDASGAPQATKTTHTYRTTSKWTRSGFHGQSSIKNRLDEFFRQRDMRDTKKKENVGVHARGANVSYTLNVSFVDAAKGAQLRVKMTNGKQLNVRIPAGTEDGQVLRLKGQGLAGLGGGTPGDAQVEIRVEQSPLFNRVGHDIHCETPITLEEALFGARITVQTLDGPVMVNIPENANTGTLLRLRGKGILRGNGDGRGDQFISLKVALPKQQDPEFREFVKRWSAAHPYRVRDEDTLDTTAPTAGKPKTKGKSAA